MIKQKLTIRGKTRPTKLKLEMAADLLERHNAWRRAGDGEMVNPKELGLALALAVKHLRGSL